MNNSPGINVHDLCSHLPRQPAAGKKHGLPAGGDGKKPTGVSKKSGAKKSTRKTTKA